MSSKHGNMKYPNLPCGYTPVWRMTSGQPRHVLAMGDGTRVCVHDKRWELQWVEVPRTPEVK